MDKNHVCMDTGKNIELDTCDRVALTNAKVLYSWLITTTFFHWKYVIKPAMPAVRYSFEGSMQKCSGSCCRPSLKHALEYETCSCMYQKRIKLKTKSSNSSSNTGNNLTLWSYRYRCWNIGKRGEGVELHMMTDHTGTVGDQLSVAILHQRGTNMTVVIALCYRWMI